MDNREQNVSQIRLQTRHLVRELDVVNSVYLDTGYTLSQCHVMFELSAHESLNLMTLAENLLIDKSNTSRTLKKLVQLGLVRAAKVSSDNRQKAFSLTAKGEKALRGIVTIANEQVETALDNLSEQQQRQAIQGIQLYAKALTRARLQAGYTIRAIQKRDNNPVAALIRDVMAEFGAIGEGYSIVDPELDDLHGAYQDKQSCYYVILDDQEVVGCGGIAPLKGSGKTTCELQKMFFLPEIRGIGLGRRLLLLLLDEARSRGYKQCYIETLERMTRANNLYRDLGFEPVGTARGKTGHNKCDRYYVREL